MKKSTTFFCGESGITSNNMESIMEYYTPRPFGKNNAPKNKAVAFIANAILFLFGSEYRIRPVYNGRNDKKIHSFTAMYKSYKGIRHGESF